MSHQSLVSTKRRLDQPLLLGRLKTSSDFKYVGNRGHRTVCKHIIIISKKSNNRRSRLGIAASKKFGKAFQRNRFKRITRMAFRNVVSQLPYAVDIIVIPRHKALTAKSQDIFNDLLPAMTP